MTNPITIMTISQKGGVGKSTIADELAFSLDRTGTPYVFHDIDGQGGCLHEGHRDEGAQVSIVDTPAGLDDRTLGLLGGVDLAVVAVNASGRDMVPFMRTLDVLHEAGDIPYLLVVTRCNRYTVCTQFVDWIQRTVGADRVCTLPAAEAFPQAYMAKKSVVEYQRGGKAVEAVRALSERVRSLVGLPPEEAKELRPQGPSAAPERVFKELADNSPRRDA